MKIIKINYWTFSFLLLAFLCGLIKNALIIFFIVIIHELGHVFFIKLLGYKINNITIYPFGGITKVDKNLNTPIKDELIIASGGLIFQSFIYLILIFLKFNFLDKNLIFSYNTSIFLFNSLPIIPLDGSIIINSFLNYFFSFKNSLKYQIIISVISIFLFTIFNYVSSLNNFLIIIFLIYKTYEFIKNYQYYQNRFYLERYLNDFHFPKISSKKGSLDILKKDTFQFFIEKDKVKSEKVKLKERFDKN